MEQTRMLRTWKPTDLVVLSTVVFASIPLAITLRLRIAGIPILNGFLLAAILAACFAGESKVQTRYRLVALYICGGIFLCAATLMNWNEPAFDARSALQDLLCYAGLPAGAAISQSNGIKRFASLVQRCYAAVCFTFALSLFLLWRGYIENTGTSERQLDGAMFTSSFIIAMCFPCMWSLARRRTASEKLMALLGLALSIIFALMSATRSVLITLFITIACTVLIEIKRNRRNIIWVTALFITVSATALSGSIPGIETFESTNLGTRLMETDVQKEDRFEELTEMLSQMGWQEWTHGVGFGSGFFSPIAAETDTGRALWPHIGISTLLYKGGLPCVLFLMIAPCLLCACRLLFFRSSDKDPFLAGVMVYLIQTCLSGGWAFLPLFLLGAFIAASLSGRSIQDAAVYVSISEASSGRSLSLAG